MAGKGLPSKHDVARGLLLKGTLFVHLDPRSDQVIVPPWFKRQPSPLECGSRRTHKPEHSSKRVATADGNLGAAQSVLPMTYGSAARFFLIYSAQVTQ